LTRADQDELIANIPNSRLVVYPNTGHALHWEQPERFARDLVEFMEH
jgi:pimeloyl-ACP methyl ester carboxylesterase